MTSSKDSETDILGSLETFGSSVVSNSHVIIQVSTEDEENNTKIINSNTTSTMTGTTSTPTSTTTSTITTPKKKSSPESSPRSRDRGRTRGSPGRRGRNRTNKQRPKSNTGRQPKQRDPSPGRDIFHGGDKKKAPLITKDELVIGDILGKGVFGKVYKGTLRGTTVAVKELKGKCQNIPQFEGEISIMCQIRHPNVVLLMGASIDPPLIVTEYLDGGDLHNVIENYQTIVKNKEQIPMNEALKLALGIAKGMTWLHQSIPPIIHKDLKPKNVMLDSNGNAKIIDFGLSEVQKSKELENRKISGSACWMAPEMLKGESYTEKIDVYAFGIILWQLFTGSPVVYDVSKYEDISPQIAFQKFIYDIADANLRPQMPSYLLANKEIVEIIECTWHSNPNLRPSFSQIVSWLNKTLLATVLNSDRDAIIMWHENFQYKTKVPLIDFYKALWRAIGKNFPSPENEDDQDSTKQKCLEAVVTVPGCNKKATINLERFGLLLHWYGPLRPLQSRHNMLDKIDALLRYSWYHGEITKEEAENILASDSPARKDFLIRCSLNPSAPFTISRIETSSRKTLEFAHHRISYNRTTGAYHMLIEAKDSIKEIKGETLAHFVKSAKVMLGLKGAVKNKKFDYIFGNKVKQGEYKIFKK